MTYLTLLGQAATAPSGGFFSNPTTIALPLILVVMYFFMIRPNQKKNKDQQKFKESVDKGMKVVTIGGIHGRIVEVKDKTFVIEANGGQKMEVEKTHISMELTKAVQNPESPVKK